MMCVIEAKLDGVVQRNEPSKKNRRVKGGGQTFLIKLDVLVPTYNTFRFLRRAFLLRHRVFPFLFLSLSSKPAPIRPRKSRPHISNGNNAQQGEG